jgi:hypothetical protein
MTKVKSRESAIVQMTLLRDWAAARRAAILHRLAAIVLLLLGAGASPSRITRDLGRHGLMRGRLAFTPLADGAGYEFSGPTRFDKLFYGVRRRTARVPKGL